MELSGCRSFIYIYIYILGYYIIACAYFLLKVGFHWIVPRDCAVGLH